MPECKNCETLLTKEEYERRGGNWVGSPDQKYYCLFRGLALTEKQKRLGKCRGKDATFPTIALYFQKLECVPIRN